MDERCACQSSLAAPEAARIPSSVRSDQDSDFSHDCRGQECCIYEPAVPTAVSYNNYPTPVQVVPSNHPLSIQQSSKLQQDIPTSSHFPNNNDDLFPARYQGVPVTPHRPITFESFLPAVTPIAPGVARSSTFHKRVLDSPNAVINESIIGPVSNLGEDRSKSPTRWICSPPNAAQSLNMDGYSSSSHMALTPYDSQDTMTNVLYMSHSARSPSPQLHSGPNHPPTSPRSPENLSDLLPWDSSHLGQEAVSVGLSPAIWAPFEASPVLSALPQSRSINTAVAGKENCCLICGNRFTQSQVLNRHMKDKHEDKGSCVHCPNFKWSRGRPYLYRRHLRTKHSGLISSEDPPGGTRNAHVLRARPYKVLNKKTQVTSRGLVPDHCCLAIDVTTFQNHLFLTRVVYVVTNNAPAILSSQLYPSRWLAIEPFPDTPF
ncbi:hypothetical protein BJY52DRAFT_1225179 [Lactarius psammicola]|nr:hypothetical protein BJY52DRAFT_1225179 [Lactarius psammicola]